MSKTICKWLGAIMAAVLVLTGCTSTKINTGNSLLQPDLKAEFAKVYFLRPPTEHVQGFADKPVTVEVDSEKLLELGKGDYALVYLKPRAVTVTLRNFTQVAGRWEVKKLERSRSFEFAAGKSYFILTRPVDGEFRGVAFIPESVGLFEAKNIAKVLKPTGEAKRARIADL